MRDRLILLPGWGLGVSPLEPLAAALRGLDEHLQVQIEPLPTLQSSDVSEWLDELDATLPTTPGWAGGPWAACSRRNWRRGAANVAAAC